jgi:GTP-binding protein
MVFRNVAIIAHVDHGKTTLVDGLLRQCKAFQEHEQMVDRVMDSMDLERERGITITSKNTAVIYKGDKINIVDTPGHADFGGEVERVLSMVDAALLLVDASEGPLPQTRFVLEKAMKEGLVIMVCINKIDRPDARLKEVINEIYDLFIDLDATEDQLEFPVLYASAKLGYASTEPEPSEDLRPLLDAMIEHIPPSAPAEEGQTPQLLVTNLDSDKYIGRLALGRLVGGDLKRNTQAVWFHEDGEKRVKLQMLYTWSGLRRKEAEIAHSGDIVAVAGIDGITVGDTISVGENAAALPRILVDEPTIGITITVNNSPLSGQDGTYLTARQIQNRLNKELLHNVSLKLGEAGSKESFKLFGRGELQLAILLEQMRREGFEMSVSRPEVVFKEVDGEILEPYESITLDVPDEYIGSMTQHLAQRKGQMNDLVSDGTGRTRMIYRIPSRGLIGFRGQMLTDTRGLGIINSLFDGWDTKVENLPRRARGGMVADRAGRTTTYSLAKLQPRGELFVGAGEDVYEGMIVGESARINDLNVNVVRGKQLTNFRESGTDEKVVLTPPRQITLENALEFIDEDEWLEITPSFLRLRKRILASNQRSIVRTPKAED